jgi:formylglycine-generating enzyme required for sulfatase activity
MVRIEGGEFVIGILPEEEEEYFQAFKHDIPDLDDELLRRNVASWINDQPLTLSTFEIARYPLTNAQYKLFIDDSGYDPDAPWWDQAGRMWLLRDDHATNELRDWQKRKYKKHPEWWCIEPAGIARPNHPVVGISWYEAVAFCRWLTQHAGYNPEGYVYLLQSEAEWEYAARRATRRLYPWGNDEPNTEQANFNDIHKNTSAVGCFPAGMTPEDGIYDLAGNVLEWTRSKYQSYPYDLSDGRENINESPGKEFVLRGGGWYIELYYLHSAFRHFVKPSSHLYYISFRLVRYPPNKT